ncbi:MAG: hypothetical protein HY425_01425 [Candidatus Levybacteria bacterium]|nr:hypothetical protein [Candidatus Levybacteria bacterium]
MDLNSFSAEEVLDRLFSNLSLPDEEQTNDGSFKTVIFPDKSQIRIGRHYFATDMGGDYFDTVFDVSMNGSFGYLAHRHALIVRVSIPQFIEIAGFKQVVPISRNEKNSFTIGLPEDKRVAIGAALVNWTKESIEQGKVPPFPGKLTFSR